MTVEDSSIQDRRQDSSARDETFSSSAEQRPRIIWRSWFRSMRLPSVSRTVAPITRSRRRQYQSVSPSLKSSKPLLFSSMQATSVTSTASSTCLEFATAWRNSLGFRSIFRYRSSATLLLLFCCMINLIANRLPSLFCRIRLRLHGNEQTPQKPLANMERNERSRTFIKSLRNPPQPTV